MATHTDLLIEICNQAFDVRAWHGPNLRGSVKGLKLPELLWRPAPDRHNIWEIALHCAYWKYTVRRRLDDTKKGEFSRKPSNFPKLPDEPTLTDWKQDIALLNEEHKLTNDAIRRFPKARLYEKPKGSPVSYIQTIYGIASHDLYHAGQIQLLKRLIRQE
jgi:hypothetical protein